jgi:methylase of polypeptide subunit release factors
LRRLPDALRTRGYRFVTITPASHSVVNARPENALAGSIDGVFGWSRPFRRAVLDEALFALAQEAGVLRRDSGADPAWRSLVRASWLDGMILLHSAYPTVAADAVFLGPDTYRFAGAIGRHVLERAVPIRRAVDIGCGSGAGGLLIARACPEAEVLLTDLNGAALAAAQVNAAAAGLENVGFLQGDLLEAVAGQFDLIVANPPYLVDGARRAYRHGGGMLGAALSLRIARDALRRLAPGGSLILYTGSAIVDGSDRLREELCGLMHGSPCRWCYREVDPDVFGEELRAPPYDRADRIAAVVFTVDRPQ